jgi:salicylate hydroxylase
LGQTFTERYGAPYLTVHRADLHAALLGAVQQTKGIELNFGSRLYKFSQHDDGVSSDFSDDRQAISDVLVGADGGWSLVRQLLLTDGTPEPTGHLAYRAMVLQADLPAHLRSDLVTVWLGPKLHVVQYPVRGGEWLNVVAIVHGQVQGDMSHWDHSANAQDLRRAMAMVCEQLGALVSSIAHWRLWPLSIREPMLGWHEQASGRVALLGDAAHPMVPYLAQGAGMAIEDAAALAWALAPSANSGSGPVNVVECLQRYAQVRWARNAHVQARAIKNGQIFHATGVMRWGRDMAMKLLGERLLDMPWLYAAAAHP